MDTADIITKCRLLPGVTVRSTDGGVAEMLLRSGEGSGKMSFFPLLPGVTLALISVAAPSWPAPRPDDCAPEASGPLIINYCTRGRCEVVLNDNKSVFLTSGHVSLTEKFARGEYVYPGRVYEGFELFIDPETARGGQPVLREYFGIDLPLLRSRCCPDGETFIAPLALPEELQRRLCGAPGGGELKRARMKTAAIDLLYLLLHGERLEERERLVYYTRAQVEMARLIEAEITADLQRRHTAREFAERFSISESSVKNYFFGVMGQSMSQYAAQQRMLRAAALLEKTGLSVIEVASRVGYLNQSKFSAAFRRHFGISPGEYRRRSRLPD